MYLDINTFFICILSTRWKENSLFQFYIDFISAELSQVILQGPVIFQTYYKICRKHAAFKIQRQILLLEIHYDYAYITPVYSSCLFSLEKHDPKKIRSCRQFLSMHTLKYLFTFKSKSQCNPKFSQTQFIIIVCLYVICSFIINTIESE